MLDVFKQRHSVRSFRQRAISFETLSEILEAVNSAPSAGGLMARETHVIADEKIKRGLAHAAFDQDFLAEAPVVLVFWALPSISAAKYGRRGRDLYCIQDATIAASFAWLQAVASGLAGCWVGSFDENAVKEIFLGRVKPDWRPIALLPIGYTAQ
jgi:nitroreductase